MMPEQPLWRRYRRLLGPDLRADVDEELAFHVETRADALVRAGLSPDAARARALAEMGDVDGARRECVRIGEAERRRRGWRDAPAAVVRDLRLGLRGLRRSPAFAAVAVLTLALSIGATTAIFSVVDGVILRPLHAADPDRLVAIFERNPEKGVAEIGPSGANFVDWRVAARSFTGMAGFRHEPLTLTGVSTPEVLDGIGTSANFFDVLGTRPLLGRTFRPGEDVVGSGRVIVISHDAWMRRFGGARDVVGRVVTIDRQPHEIVGVMPAGFAFPGRVDAWRPTDLTRSSGFVGLTADREHRTARYLDVVARLKPGVTVARAAEELDAIAETLARAHPVENGGWRTAVLPLGDARVRQVRPVLLLLFGAVALVLLIACANVASLTLSRAVGREGEVALRAALGAGHARLRLQMLTESVALSAVGGALGVALAWVGVRAFARVAPATLPRVEDVAIDARVLAFAVAVSTATGLACGLAPALRLAGTAAASVLREAGRSIGGGGGRRSERLRRALVVAEVALSLMLLVGAGLTLQSVLRVLSLDLGYTTRDVIAARVSLDGNRYGDNGAKARHLRALVGRLAAIPGVLHVGITSTFPLTSAGIDFGLEYHAEGQPEVPEGRAPRVDYRMISPGYVEAMGLRLRAGRAFETFDRVPGEGGRRVMLVNEAFARRNWPNESAVGKRVRLHYISDEPWEVVGVLGDTRHAELTAAPRPQVFVPVEQAELLFGYMTLVVRTRAAASGVVPAMRAAAVALDPSEPLYGIETIEALHAAAMTRERLTAIAFGGFAVIAVVLAAAGIYGVIAYQVARRTREIGVRIALGASRGRVVREVVGEAMRLALLGVALGAAGAIAGARAARGVLFGVSAADPLTFGGVIALLLAVAVVAALRPAARAAGIAPVEALRAG